MKLTGSEWIAFDHDATVWKNEAYYEGETFIVNGVEVEAGEEPRVNPTDQIEILGGAFYPDPDDMSSGLDLESVIRAWKKKQKSATVVVTIPKDKLDAFMAEIKKLGGKIIK